jgi:hypothetical protein
MTSESQQPQNSRYRQISYVAGLCCSCFIITFVIGLFIVRITSGSNGQVTRWSGILPGISIIGGIISAVVCIVAGLIGRFHRVHEDKK